MLRDIMGRKVPLAIVIGSVIATCLTVMFVPDSAFAASGALPAFQNGVKALQAITTALLLPIAVVIVAWKMVYIAVFGGILGMDPMNMITDTDKDGQIGLADVKVSLIAHAGGFVKGLAWVGGVFVVFQVVLGLAATFAGVFADNFAS